MLNGSATSRTPRKIIPPLMARCAQYLLIKHSGPWIVQAPKDIQELNIWLDERRDAYDHQVYAPSA